MKHTWTFGKHPTADCWFVQLGGQLEIYVDTEDQARLIAAAPDLLEVLEAVCSLYGDGFANDIRALARAAIAKVQP